MTNTVHMTNGINFIVRLVPGFLQQGADFYHKREGGRLAKIW